MLINTVNFLHSASEWGDAAVLMQNANILMAAAKLVLVSLLTF